MVTEYAKYCGPGAKLTAENLYAAQVAMRKVGRGPQGGLAEGRAAGKWLAARKGLAARHGLAAWHGLAAGPAAGERPTACEGLDGV
jgi:hypothetical protein